MATTCWQCNARLRAASPYCEQCGSAIAARVSIDEPARRQHSRWPAIALSLALFTAGLAFLSIDSPPTVPEEAAAPPVAALAVDDDRNEFRTLGRVTGTTAVVLTASSLELIDLDTAQRRTVLLDGKVSASTVDVGRRLLLTEGALLVATGPAVFAFDLTSGEVSNLGTGDRLAPSRTPAHAWIWNQIAASWREIDGHGEVVREIEPPPGSSAWDHGVGTPELVATPTLGVHALQQDGSWQSVATGLAVAGNNNVALTRECPSLEACEYRLIEVATGAVIEQPWATSLDPTPSTQLRISPSGASLLEMKPTNRSWESVYVYTGVTVRPTSCTQGWRDAAWSVDETLLACATNGGVAVTDVKNGPAAVFDDWEEQPLAVILAPTGSLRLPAN